MSRAVAVGSTYGGVTSQHQPVVVDMTTNRRLIVRAVAAVTLTCTSGPGPEFAIPLTRVAVTKSGKFSRSFGPVTLRNDDGTTSDFEGRISGTLNHAKTLISGTSRLKVTDHDGTGAQTDFCDSGSVTWKAKQ